MTGMQASYEAHGVETNSVESEHCEGSRGMAVELREKTREAAGGTVCAKSASPANTDGVRQNVTGEANRRVGSRKPPEPPGKSGGNGHADVSSVGELVVIVCDDPESRKKRLKVAEALRERGLNESKLAAMYSGLAEKLSRNKEEGAVGVAAAKLLFDVLKELADWLEPPKTAGDSTASEAPRFVRLIHNVPRPVRTE
jgi:hypothetical protein